MLARCTPALMQPMRMIYVEYLRDLFQTRLARIRCKAIEPCIDLNHAQLCTNPTLAFFQALELVPSILGANMAAHRLALRWVRDRSQVGTYGIEQEMYRFSFVVAA